MSTLKKYVKTPNWENLSEILLKGALLRRGLDSTGTKQELVKRAKQSIIFDVKGNVTGSKDCSNYFLKRSRMYQGQNYVKAVRSVIISPFTEDVLASECFQKWFQVAASSRMGKNEDGKSGVVLKFQYTDQGDKAYLDLKADLTPFDIKVWHPKHPTFSNEEVVDILNVPLIIYQRQYPDGVGFARKAVLLEKVPTSLLAEEKLRPYFPEAVDLFVYSNLNQVDTGVILEFDTEPAAEAFLEVEQQTLVIEGHRLSAKKYSTASQKYVKQHLNSPGKVKIDDETRVAMCKEFTRRNESMAAIVDGDQHVGADKLIACEEAMERFSNIKREIVADTERRVAEGELKMPESEDVMLFVTVEVLKNAAENGGEIKSSRYAKKRVLLEPTPKPEPKVTTDPEPKGTIKYPLPKLKPLPVKPKATTTTGKPSVPAKKKAPGKPPAIIKNLMESDPFEAPPVKQARLPRGIGLLGDTPRQQQRPVYRNPSNVQPKQLDRWQGTGPNLHSQQRQQVTQRERAWPDTRSISRETKLFRDPVPSRSTIAEAKQFRETPLQSSTLDVPRNGATAMVDNLAHAFVSIVAELKKSKQEPSDSGFYDRQDTRVSSGSSKESLMPRSHSFRQEGTIDSLMPNRRDFRDEDVRGESGLNIASLVPSSHDFRGKNTSVGGGGYSRENLMPNRRDFRDDNIGSGSGISRDSLMSSSFRNKDPSIDSEFSRDNLMPYRRDLSDADMGGRGGLSRDTLIPSNRGFRNEGARGVIQKDSSMQSSRDFRDEQMLKRDNMPSNLGFRNESLRGDSGFNKDSLMQSIRDFREEGMGGGRGGLDRDSIMPSNLGVREEGVRGDSYMQNIRNFRDEGMGGSSGLTRDSITPSNLGFRNEASRDVSAFNKDSSMPSNQGFRGGNVRDGDVFNRDKLRPSSQGFSGEASSFRRGDFRDDDVSLKRGVPRLDTVDFSNRDTNLKMSSSLTSREEYGGARHFSRGVEMSGRPGYYHREAEGDYKRDSSRSGFGSGSSDYGFKKGSSMHSKGGH